MDNVNIVWIVSFTIVLITLNCLYPLIFDYIDNKPMGCKSIFDLVMKDHFKVARFTGTTYCLIALISRCPQAVGAIRDSNILAISACSVYEFAYATVCYNIACTCVIRILCLFSITFVEETIGENVVRKTLAFSTILCGAVTVAVEIYSKDIASGISFNLLTGNFSTTGKKTPKQVIIYMLSLRSLLF